MRKSRGKKSRRKKSRRKKSRRKSHRKSQKSRQSPKSRCKLFSASRSPTVVTKKAHKYSALYLKKMPMRMAVGKLDPSLWAGNKGEGKLAKGKVYKVMRDLKVYRAYNSFNSHSPLGHWWTFNPIKGSVSNYRVHEDICISWSPLDRMISGTLKKNTLIAYGGGQSIRCDEYIFFPPQPSFKQVYIPNPVRDVVDFQPPKAALFKWVDAIYDDDNCFALQKY